MLTNNLVDDPTLFHSAKKVSKNAVALLLLPSKILLKRGVIGDRFISFRASSNTSALQFVFLSS
jgi:hypothetical protein